MWRRCKWFTVLIERAKIWPQSRFIIFGKNNNSKNHDAILQKQPIFVPFSKCLIYLQHFKMFVSITNPIILLLFVLMRSYFRSICLILQVDKYISKLNLTQIWYAICFGWVPLLNLIWIANLRKHIWEKVLCLLHLHTNKPQYSHHAFPLSNPWPHHL